MWNQDHYAEFGPPTFTTFDPVSVTYTNGGRGWLGTIGGGCDYQTPLFNNRVVIGVFGDYDPMSLTGTNESQLPITHIRGGYFGQRNRDWSLVCGRPDRLSGHADAVDLF